MKKGFTLIELIGVMAILIILAGILIPTAIGFISRANEAADLANARLLYSAALVSIANDKTYATGTFTADSLGKTPAIFTEYVGSHWPVPRVAGSKYFETVIAESNGMPTVDIYRIMIDKTEIYNKALGKFIPQ